MSATVSSSRTEGAHAERTQRRVGRRTLAGATAAAVIAVGGWVVAPQGSQAATGPTAPIACPTAFPTTSAVDGVTGVGFTVEKGTTPDPFTATVLGRLTDGIAPGVDMIMAELDSPALQRAGGIWAGMSGSPVYSSDGRLIGSVSYGLSASPSRIAGITPAESMKALLAQSAATGAPALKAKVAAPSAAVQKMAATGAVTTAAASGGFSRLSVPVWVSGAGSPKASSLLQRLQQKIPEARVMGGGASSSTTQGAASLITAGGNFAASVSYGDATLGGIGTTTFVCNGVAVAFGHPFLDSGQSSMTAHAADAIYVQADSTFGSFKVANITTPVGTLNGDFTTGIRAKLGTLPAATLITSSIAKSGGTPVTGTTKATYLPFTADAAAYHAFYNVQKALNSDATGSAALTITIKGTKANGSAFTLTRKDSYSSNFSIANEVANQLYMMVDSVVNQPFTKVKLTSINISGTVSTSQSQYRVTSLKVKKGASFVAVTDPIAATAGSPLTLQATLAPYQGVGSNKTVTLSLAVPAGSSGGSGTLQINSGNNTLPGDAQTFAQFLSSWQTVGLNSSLAASLDLGTGTPVTATATVPGVVSPYAGSYSVNVG